MGYGICLARYIFFYLMELALIKFEITAKNIEKRESR